MVLRSPFTSGDQKFDSNGKSLNPAPAGPWLLFGAIYVEKLKLSSNNLSIQAYRVAFGVDRKGKQTLIALGKTVQVEIHLEQPLQSIDQVQAVLGRVFLQGASLDDAKPELRRSDDSTLGEPVYHISKDSTKDDATLTPKVTYTPEPEFSDAARKARFQGTAILQIVIDKTGKVSTVRLERALGYGLDENAMESAKTWRFEPATRNGQPVAVEMKIEVSFKLS
jgi:TonB family protein